MNSRKLIQLYLDGQLDDTDRQRAEEILKNDPEARAELGDYQKIGRALKEAAVSKGAVSQPNFMGSRVKAAIECGDAAGDDAGGRERIPWWNWDYRWAFAGVAASVMCSLALVFWAQRSQIIVLQDPRKQGYSSVTVYTFDPQVYPAEYRSPHAGANVIWLTGADAYGAPQAQEKS